MSLLLLISSYLDIVSSPFPLYVSAFFTYIIQKILPQESFETTLGYELTIQSCFKVVDVLVSFGGMEINEGKHGEHN
jgi:hypothetical protein